jgi:hypothetical protein
MLFVALFLAPIEGKILVIGNASFFLLKKIDQRKILFLDRKTAFVEQDWNESGNCS